LIRIEDQGQGIPVKEQGKLFKAFSRSSVRPIGGEQSTGLGLLIAKRIVNGHCGELWLESDGSEGASFFVSLPLLIDGEYFGGE
jgi:two-component system, sensor histidine kinase and response regulator